MDDNEIMYKEIGRVCSINSQYLHTDLLISTDSVQIKWCNDLKRRALTSQNVYTQLIFENVDNIHKVFHPTQDRLDSWWLRTLLGDKAYEVVKVYSDL